MVKNSKIIFFTDAWTITPKKDFITYSISKDFLKSFLKSLAINYKNYIFLWIDMWPVNTNKIWIKKEEFYKKALIKIKNPTLWLINFLNFLIKEENFYSTWTIVDFSWGTYLIRNNNVR